MRPSPPPRWSSRSLLWAAILCTAVSLGCWALFFALYWPYRRLFNEAGVYFDESVGVVAHEQTALLAVPALAFALLAVLGFGVWLARRRHHS